MKWQSEAKHEATTNRENPISQAINRENPIYSRVYSRQVGARASIWVAGWGGVLSCRRAVTLPAATNPDHGRSPKQAHVLYILDVRLVGLQVEQAGPRSLGQNLHVVLAALSSNDAV